MALEMPFGKYQGNVLADVPMRYLDETVSIMPPKLFVRLVQKALELIQLETGSQILHEGRVADITCRQAFGDMVPAMNKLGNDWRQERIRAQDLAVESLQNASLSHGDGGATPTPEKS